MLGVMMRLLCSIPSTKSVVASLSHFLSSEVQDFCRDRRRDDANFFGCSVDIPSHESYKGVAKTEYFARMKIVDVRYDVKCQIIRSVAPESRTSTDYCGEMLRLQ